MIGTACSAAFGPDALYAEIRTAAPYRELARADFDDALAFAATGGYALGAYERYRRLKRDADGAYAIADVTHLRRYRINVGTIVAEPMLEVRFGRGRVLGEVKEHFAQALVPGDTFSFAGQLLEFVRIRDMAVECRRGRGGRFQGPGLWRYKHASDHASRRSSARDAGPAAALECAAAAGPRVARASSRALHSAEP